MGIPILTEVQKGHISGKKSPHNLLQNVLLKLYYQHEGHWYGNSLFHIPTIYREFVLFQFLCCGLCLQILILKKAQKRQTSDQKTGHDSLKNALLKLSFQHDGHLHANCLTHILSIY